MARKIFVKVQWEFSTAGHLVFWKPYLSRLKILKNYAYTSSENLSTTIRNLYLESLGISKQSLNTLLRFPGFLWIFIGSSLSVWELECFLSVENIEISLYAQTQQSLLLLTQGNIYHCLKFLNKYLLFLEELNKLFRKNWSKFLTSGYQFILVFWKQFPAAGYLDTSFKIIQTISINNYTEPSFYLKIYAHLCGYLLTLMYPFIILYALFFIKLKNLWIKNLLAEIYRGGWAQVELTDA